MSMHTPDQMALIAQAKTIFHDSEKSDRHTLIYNAEVSAKNPEEAVIITTKHMGMGHAGEFLVNVKLGTVERRY